MLPSALPFSPACHCNLRTFCSTLPSADVLSYTFYIALRVISNYCIIRSENEGGLDPTIYNTEDLTLPVSRRQVYKYENMYRSSCRWQKVRDEMAAVFRLLVRFYCNYQIIIALRLWNKKINWVLEYTTIILY